MYHYGVRYSLPRPQERAALLDFVPHIATITAVLDAVIVALFIPWVLDNDFRADFSDRRSAYSLPLRSPHQEGLNLVFCVGGLFLGLWEDAA